MYKVTWNKKALDDLNHLPAALGDDIKAKVETYLACNPRALSASLGGPLKGLYKYRYGKHRVIKEIEVIKVKHRSKAYEIK